MNKIVDQIVLDDNNQPIFKMKDGTIRTLYYEGNYNGITSIQWLTKEEYLLKIEEQKAELKNIKWWQFWK